MPNARTKRLLVIEATIASIWQHVLHVERVGRHDHFFELGGHSLHAVQFVSIYGLAASSLLEEETPLRTVEAMAVRYIHLLIDAAARS